MMMVERGAVFFAKGGEPMKGAYSIRRDLEENGMIDCKVL